MTKKISKDWSDWIKVNQDRGCDLDEMYKILAKEGFDPSDIKESLGYQPVSSHLDNKSIIGVSKISFFRKIQSFYEEYKIVKKRLIEEENQERLGIAISIDQKYKLKSSLAEIYSIDDFLNKKECEKLIGIIKKRLKPSTIATSGIEKDKQFRTSRTCDLGNVNDPFVEEIDRRM